MPLRLKPKKNSPNWYIRGTVRGIYVEESTGTDNKKAAEAIRIKRESEILDRSIFGAKSTATFLEGALGYMEMTGNTRYVMKLVEHMGSTVMAEIDQAEVEKIALELYPTAAPATLKRQVFTPLSAVVNHAAVRGLCPPLRLKRPEEPKGRVRWIAPELADKLIDECAPHLRPLVVLLFYTGARVSEALYLDWENVDLTARRVVYRDTKNGLDRGVPLHERVVVELANIPHRDGPVFLKPGGKPYQYVEESGGQIKTAFNGACERAGIVNFHPHDCRHTWATWHYMKNRDLVGLMKLGGWQSEKMVLRYTHINPDHLAPGIDILPWENRAKSGQ